MACSQSSIREVLIVNALDLDIVTDKILEYLPIRVAARASVLSKQWRRSWLSLKRLVFVENFWSDPNDGSNYCWFKGSTIISNILLNHDGPVHHFQLQHKDTKGVNQNHWLPFLSKHGVRYISINNWSGDAFNMSSYIFCCSDLVHLRIDGCTLNPPPTGFSGYQNLKHLELISIYFRQENVFWSLVENCGMLTSLKLENCKGVKHVVIDAPSLRSLVLIGGGYESIAFTDVRHLQSIHISGAINLIGVTNLASSSQLQSITFNGQICKLLAAGDFPSFWPQPAGDFPRSPPVTFNYVNKLCLYDLEFCYLGVLRCVLGIIESCPYVKMLDIAVLSGGDDEEVPEVEYNFSSKLDHLLEVKFRTIKGSLAELKVIEYLLAVSTVLKTLSFMPCWSLDTKLELEMSRKLMKFPRASPKAELIYLIFLIIRL